MPLGQLTKSTAGPVIEPGPCESEYRSNRHSLDHFKLELFFFLLLLLLVLSQSGCRTKFLAAFWFWVLQIGPANTSSLDSPVEGAVKPPSGGALLFPLIRPPKPFREGVEPNPEKAPPPVPPSPVALREKPLNPLKAPPPSL